MYNSAQGTVYMSGGSTQTLYNDTCYVGPSMYHDIQRARIQN